jgi:5-methylthioribose kinase
MNLREKFEAAHPQVFYLDESRHEALQSFLQEKDWLSEDEPLVKLEKPGEGNMNKVLRAITNRRSFILKQSRPWVAKYPQVPAPVERVKKEYRFYQLIAEAPELSHSMPALIASDEAQLMLTLEDLGEGADYSFLYQDEKRLADEELSVLLQFISKLHSLKKGSNELDNQEMKHLNHEHIFVFPYLKENGFDLDEVQPGLQSVSLRYKTHKPLKQKINELGEIYLQEHNCLLHGDYYPGSWLKVSDGIRIIDPEFAHFGRAEFDLGVFTAHLRLSKHPDDVLRKVLQLYQQPTGFDDKLCRAFAGVEVLRRLIGLAQLPLNLSLEEKDQLMQAAEEAIMQW